MTAKEFGQREADRLRDAKWDPSAVEVVRHMAEKVAADAMREMKERCCDLADTAADEFPNGSVTKTRFILLAGDIRTIEVL